jgi:hypothetical protein
MGKQIALIISVIYCHLLFFNGSKPVLPIKIVLIPIFHFPLTERFELVGRFKIPPFLSGEGDVLCGVDLVSGCEVTTLGRKVTGAGVGHFIVLCSS